MPTGAGSVLVGKELYPRSPQQQQYDFFRQRQQQLDIEHMRKQMDKQEFDQKTPVTILKNFSVPI